MLCNSRFTRIFPTSLQPLFTLRDSSSASMTDSWRCRCPTAQECVSALGPRGAVQIWSSVEGNRASCSVEARGGNFEGSEALFGVSAQVCMCGFFFLKLQSFERCLQYEPVHPGCFPLHLGRAPGCGPVTERTFLSVKPGKPLLGQSIQTHL